MNKIDNHGLLYSDIEVLRQLSGVLDVQIIDAEVPRQVQQYVLIRIILDSGRQVARLMLYADKATRPCPAKDDMMEEWAEAEEAGRQPFFTAREILNRKGSTPLDVANWEEEEENTETEEDESTVLG